MPPVNPISDGPGTRSGVFGPWLGVAVGFGLRGVPGGVLRGLRGRLGVGGRLNLGSRLSFGCRLGLGVGCRFGLGCRLGLGCCRGLGF
ncbi:MAG TPA: hypothetical protein VNM42_08585, partial [Solirubrobacterales bacterium]|nr:hypothetical protein [Solirubrobacterales bacterium]